MTLKKRPYAKPCITDEGSLKDLTSEQIEELGIKDALDDLKAEGAFGNLVAINLEQKRSPPSPT